MGINKSRQIENDNPARGMSLGKRLPLLISILLLSLIITFSAIAYFGVRNAAMAIGKERLRSLTDQLGSMFSKSAVVVSTQVQAVAGDTAIKKFIQQGNEQAALSPIVDLLKTLRKDTLVVLVELMDANRQLIAKSGIENLKININRDSALKELIQGKPASVGNFYQSGDSIYYPVSAGVKNGNTVIGYMLQWHLLHTTPQTLEQLSQLMGTHAALYFGNDDGSLWTDLMKQVKAPPIKNKDNQEIHKYARDGGEPLLAALNKVPGSSWVILVEFSESLVVNTADRFLYWMIVAGIVLVIAGIVITAIMSRNITRPLKKLTAAVSSINPDGKPALIQINRKDEIGRLANAFNSMISEIGTVHDDLKVKVSELQYMTEQLRNLSAHIEKIREDERISIARDLHDELGQLLTAFKMDVVILKRRLGENAPAPMLENIADLTKGADEAIKFVRRLASDLRPQILDDLGLVATLEWFSEEFTKRYSIEIIFHSEAEHFETTPEIATGLFRLYQESLTNVARHSEATKVHVELGIKEGMLCLSVTDNGKGFDMQAHNRKGLGLLGMKERSLIMGGRLEIVSSPGKGTSVTVNVLARQNIRDAAVAVSTH